MFSISTFLDYACKIFSKFLVKQCHALDNKHKFLRQQLIIAALKHLSGQVSEPFRNAKCWLNA